MSRDVKPWVVAIATAFATYLALMVVISAAGGLVSIIELAIIAVIAGSFAVLAFGLTERRL